MAIPVGRNLKEQAIRNQTKLDPCSKGWISSAVFQWEPMSSIKGPLRMKVQTGSNLEVMFEEAGVEAIRRGVPLSNQQHPKAASDDRPANLLE